MSAAATVLSMTPTATEFVAEVAEPDGSRRLVRLPLGQSPEHDRRLRAIEAFVREGGELEVVP